MVTYTHLDSSYSYQSGYVTDNTQFVRGLSPMHDSGTGASSGKQLGPDAAAMLILVISGSYGNFEIMPLLCPDGFDFCTTSLDARQRLRKNNTDVSVLF